MKYSRGIRNLIILVLFSVSMVQCHHDRGLRNVEEADISISRFDEDLFSISVYGIADSIPWLEQKYPEFFPLFTHRILEIGGPGDPDFEAALTAFISDFTIYRVSQRIHELYPDMSNYATALGKAFGRFEYYFPGKTVPQVITCLSGFNQSIITADSLLAISLDKYLGPEDEFYQLLYPPVPEYMRKVMRPEKIVPDALQAWVITEFPYKPLTENLLSNMIYQGRALYCVKQLLPEISDSLLWGFSNDEYEFCTRNEKNMWEYLVENKKLFVTDAFTIGQFVNEAPFTRDYSQDSPGRAAVWQGYRIVKSYMKYNPEVTMNRLMEENDFQRILNLSRYNP